jgi:hypothetical protein
MTFLAQLRNSYYSSKAQSSHTFSPFLPGLSRTVPGDKYYQDGGGIWLQFHAWTIDAGCCKIETGK